MSQKPAEFFKAIVEVPSPSGYEQPAASLMREYVAPWADAVETNVMGSVHALVKGTAEGPSVMLAAHIDEIGLMVSYVTAEGFIAFRAIGGVDAAVLPGKRVRVHTTKGTLLGLVGRMPIHLLDDEDRKVVTKLHKLFIDVGLDGEAVKDRVRLGDPITFDVGMEHLGDGMAVSRAFDVSLGKGPILTRGANINPKVVELLVEAGESEGLLLQFEGDPRATGTAANAIQLSRGGRAAGLVSVPLRYLHTQNEMLSLGDVEAAIELLTAFVLKLRPGTDFTP